MGFVERQLKKEFKRATRGVIRKAFKRVFKGWFGEKKTALNMWVSLDDRTYKKFHNIIIPSSNGTTQIDHLIVSVFGIVIVETKNKDGWIFGEENQARWTQVIFKEKYSFQNPLRQSYRQKKVLSGFLGINESSISTVVHFVGDCVFKTILPCNVIKSGFGKYIRSFRDQVFTHDEVARITQKLESYLAHSNLTNRDHVRSLKERHHSKKTCPRCGSELVLRTAKKGSNKGAKFLGCAGYPKCRYIRNG